MQIAWDLHEEAIILLRKISSGANVADRKQLLAATCGRMRTMRMTYLHIQTTDQYRCLTVPVRVGTLDAGEFNKVDL